MRGTSLIYVSDDAPGLGRVRSGSGFRYVTARGVTIKDPRVLARIRSLAIPPAWTNVWICETERGHIQATGRDGRNRKQYRYHPHWRQTRDVTKFEHLIDFAHALPRIRRAVARDLKGPGLSHDKVVAVIVSLLEITRARVGNDEYARANDHFGLTTLRDKHAVATNARLRLRFVGKSGKVHSFEIADARLAKLVRTCQDLPGQRLFQYVDDDGIVRPVGSGDVNDYLRRVSGLDITAKDFRTWAGTVLVAEKLRNCETPATAAAAKSEVIAALDLAASHLRNTRAVCRSSYVHPFVLAEYERGVLAGPRMATGRVINGLSPSELATVRILERATKPRAQRVAA